MTRLKKVFAAAMSVAVAAGIVALSGCSSPKPSAIETYTVEGDTLRVGIISDLQLEPEGGSDTYDNAYRRALELLKAENVDMMINVGDYTDTNTQEAADNVSRILNEVYPAEERPYSLSIMGNHDYWLPYFVDCWEIPFKGKMQRRTMEAVGESSPWTHKVVNGYHFIGFSPCNGDMDDGAYTDKIDWAREQIEIAVQENPDKPVFVITHAPPTGTVNSNLDTGEDSNVLDELFSSYPQVVSISGHTHAPLMDDRSIWQGEYTAVNTQCLSYISTGLSAGEDADSIEQNPMCLIMEVTTDRLTFTRYSVLTGEQQGDVWQIDLPVAQHLDQYTDARAEQSAAPVFPEDAQITASFETYDPEQGAELVLRFPSAQHERYVYGYHVTATDPDGNPKLLFPTGVDEDGNAQFADQLSFVSDFYLGFDRMAAETVLRLSPAVTEYAADFLNGTYTLSVTATDTWGHESAPIRVQITIDGQNIATAPGVQ